ASCLCTEGYDICSSLVTPLDVPQDPHLSLYLGNDQATSEIYTDRGVHRAKLGAALGGRARAAWCGNKKQCPVRIDVNEWHTDAVEPADRIQRDSARMAYDHEPF